MCGGGIIINPRTPLPQSFPDLQCLCSMNQVQGKHSGWFSPSVSTPSLGRSMPGRTCLSGAQRAALTHSLAWARLVFHTVRWSTGSENELVSVSFCSWLTGLSALGLDCSAPARPEEPEDAKRRKQGNISHVKQGAWSSYHTQKEEAWRDLIYSNHIGKGFQEIPSSLIL